MTKKNICYNTFTYLYCFFSINHSTYLLHFTIFSQHKKILSCFALFVQHQILCTNFFFQLFTLIICGIVGSIVHYWTHKRQIRFFSTTLWTVLNPHNFFPRTATVCKSSFSVVLEQWWSEWESPNIMNSLYIEMLAHLWF